MAQQKKSKPSRKRRVVMIFVGVGLGLLCKALPPHYHGPCAVVAKLVGLFLGVS